MFSLLVHDEERLHLAGCRKRRRRLRQPARHDTPSAGHETSPDPAREALLDGLH
jgi:hypothetical protein